MDSRAVLRQSIALADMIAERYLSDLENAELFVRPAPGANHIAWQLGHLIASEYRLINGIRPGSMPDLPESFIDQYTKETAEIDDPSQFHTKDDYLRLLKQNREATLAVVDQMSDEDLDQEAPEMLRERFPTIGAIMALQAIHTTMHAGQWAILRRQLGKPVVI